MRHTVVDLLESVVDSIDVGEDEVKSADDSNNVTDNSWKPSTISIPDIGYTESALVKL